MEGRGKAGHLGGEVRAGEGTSHEWGPSLQISNYRADNGNQGILWRIRGAPTIVTLLVSATASAGSRCKVGKSWCSIGLGLDVQSRGEAASGGLPRPLDL